MVHRPIHDAHARQTTSGAAKRSTRGRSRSRRCCSFCGPGSCTEVSRRRAQDGFCGGPMMGSGRDQESEAGGTGGYERKIKLHLIHE